MTDPTPATSVRIELEIRPRSEPIQGQVKVGGVVHEFTGWVALCLILESVLQGESSLRHS